MIDVHCHLIDTKYQDRDPQSIVEEAKKAGVQMIVNGTGVSESKKSLDIADKNNGVWVCVGTAYETGNENLEKIRKELKMMCGHPKVVGIGEAGLNYYSGMNEELKEYQQNLFEMHLELAREFDLPIEIHNREADADIMKEVKKYQVKTLLHCFSGTNEFMQQMVNPGCYFSFGGMITYKKNEALREIVRQVPADRLLLETDAPYLPPEPVRGTINTPVNVKIVARRMAEIKGVSIEEIDRITSRNVRRLFSKLK